MGVSLHGSQDFESRAIRPMGGESKGARATQTAGDGWGETGGETQLEVWKIFENGVSNFKPPMNVSTFQKSQLDVSFRYSSCITPESMADLHTFEFLLSRDIVAQRSSI